MSVGADSAAGRCELCRRRVASLTRHHLIPRTRLRKRRARRRAAPAWPDAPAARICGPCHRQIHALIDERELERDYGSLERLASHPGLARFVSWIRRRPDGGALPRRPRRAAAARARLSPASGSGRRRR